MKKKLILNSQAQSKIVNKGEGQLPGNSDGKASQKKKEKPIAINKKIS